jgi:hypothetical protein
MSGYVLVGKIGGGKDNLKRGMKKEMIASKKL